MHCAHHTHMTGTVKETMTMEHWKLTQETPAPAVYRSSQARPGQATSGQDRTGQDRSGEDHHDYDIGYDNYIVVSHFLLSLSQLLLLLPSLKNAYYHNHDYFDCCYYDN